ncbi:MAG: hypothetical protein EU541_06005 [Promethearchaeota archaeon]|nr:MAG: hypothetical protein EU541_06005 [Candidatus Lokiarchaeota archaeon]
MSDYLIKSFKDDFAPILFYFDIFSTEIFKHPILPLPLRIDRLYNGDTTAFIYPNAHQIQTQLNELDLVLNYYNFYKIGLNNFVKYSKLNYSKLKNDFSDLKNETIKEWFRLSCDIVVHNPDLEKDLTFMISEFINLYSIYLKKGIKMDSACLKELLIDHCDKIVDYFRNKIEKNEIITVKDKEEQIVELYKERRSKFYPDIIEHDVVILNNYKVRKMKFVPYLIYDDILDCYTYNKKLLLEGEKESYPLDLWQVNQIINKRSNIENINKEIYDLKYFNISEVNLDNIL